MVNCASVVRNFNYDAGHNKEVYFATSTSTPIYDGDYIVGDYLC